MFFRNLSEKIPELRGFSSSLSKKLRDGVPYPLLVSGLPLAARAMLLAAAAGEGYFSKGKSLLIITETERDAYRVFADLLSFYPSVKAVLCPESDISAFAGGVGSKEYLFKRISALSALISGEADLAVCSSAAAASFTCPPEVFSEAVMRLKSGAALPQGSLTKTAEKLAALGYERADAVTAKGQFSIRGAIFDIFPSNSEIPFRIELWDDEIDTVSSFDADTQRRIDTVKEIFVPPAGEFPEEGFTLLDYAEKVCLCEHFNVFAGYQEGDGFLSKKDFAELAFNKSCLFLDTFPRSDGLPLSGLITPDCRTVAPWSGDYDGLTDELSDYTGDGYTVFLFAGEEKAAKTLAFDLHKQNGFNAVLCGADKAAKIIMGGIYIFPGTLTGGIDFPKEKFLILSHISAETKIRGGSQSSSPKTKKKKKGSISSLTDISEGDYVVHEKYGIGIFLGITKIKENFVERDYIKIKYSGTSELCMPVGQLDMIARYVGNTDGLKLSSINSSVWARKKQRARESAELLADELIQIYAERAKAKGFAFPEDGERQIEFENRFPYIETEDQLSAASEIKADMESPRPMDRLLCGDVGFGKTEVALRAAYKAVCAGKQTALLCPTTVLAWQHFKTALKRMNGLKVRIELLSRFRSAGEASAIRRKCAAGEIDLLIGTHSLIGKSTVFKNLGLLIIDEEQRFGVMQKDRLKEMFPDVDCLTLSATPIPRTLNMAMGGLRDMSLIETPPSDRRPVSTCVTEYDPALVRHALENELKRDGQAYYVFNSVEHIYAKASYLQKLVPEARIGVGHGQMDEGELLEVWRQLLEREIDILVSTTIIETGVDVPNVNTLIVENAERFGLSQLHQLRGRVGRTNRRAYAYFTFRKNSIPSEIQQKRLDALREFTKFGAGFRIAMRDLEIRGAGSMLGKMQSGHLSDVGYELYVRMIEESVAAKKGEKLDRRSLLEQVCEIDIKTDAFIPKEYISSETERINAYRRIAAARSDDDIYDVTDEFLDRYGETPKPLNNLIEVAKLRVIAEKLSVTSISHKKSQLFFYFKPDFNFAALNSAKVRFQMQLADKERPSVSIEQGGSPVKTAFEFLSSLAGESMGV